MCICYLLRECLLVVLTQNDENRTFSNFFFFFNCELLSSFEILHRTLIYKTAKGGTALGEAAGGSILFFLWSPWDIFREPSNWQNVT